MAAKTGDESRAWAADKREFLADSRDEAADARDVTADGRDVTGDAREAELDQREVQLNVLASDLGLNADEGPGKPILAARAARIRAKQDRSELAVTRDDEKVAREEAIARRLAEGRPTLLAEAFARIAEYLFDAESTDDVLARISQAAVATVAGSEAASITLLEAGSYRTTGSTAQAATEIDQAQYDADEGPCLDAVNSPMVAAPSYPDERWPRLGSAPPDHGMQSSVSYQLAWSTREGAESGTGSLNIYGLTPDAFDESAMEIGAILAAHASLAARAVGERVSLEQLDRHLEEALLSRDVIGQAKGILMERLKTTPEKAFEILKDSSQRLNLKLREVARNVAETGEMAS